MVINIPDHPTPGAYRKWCRKYLGLLTVRHWAAFAASCAARQFGTYLYVSKLETSRKPKIIQYAIALGWKYAAGEQIGRSDLENQKNQVDLLIPNLDEDSSAYSSLILDATGATSYLLDVCLNGNIDDAIFAGECALNAVDEWVLDLILAAGKNDRPVPVTIKPGEFQALQQKVNLHPLMQREIQQQLTELTYLEKHATLGPHECDELQKLWKNGTKSNLDLE
jgi:hypothetical protein